MTYILKLKFRFYTRCNLPKGIVNEVIIKITILKNIHIHWNITETNTLIDFLQIISNSFIILILEVFIVNITKN